MPTLLLLALLGQPAPVSPPEVTVCDLTAIPVVCDLPGLGTRPSTQASSDDLCEGNFVENCKRYALATCHLSVGQVKGTVQGSKATCSVTCANQSIEQKKSCELSSANPIAKCIYPACPLGCLDCVDLDGGQCRFIGISDDPDPVPRFGHRRGEVGLDLRSNTSGGWVCE